MGSEDLWRCADLAGASLVASEYFKVQKFSPNIAFPPEGKNQPLNISAISKMISAVTKQSPSAWFSIPFASPIQALCHELRLSQR